MQKKSIVFFLTLIITLFAFTVSATEQGYVNCNMLNVRVSPNTECAVLTQLPFGTPFDIIYADNGWYNIRMQDNVTGFVSAPYVKKGIKDITLHSDVASQIVTDAHQYLGYRYVYGTAGPSSFDCSGFTSYLYKKYGYSLPRSSYEQGSYGTYIEKSDLVPGDLLFFSNRGDRRINHVGLYIGDGNMIHASTSNRGVVLNSIYSSYYTTHYVCARRVL